MLKNVTIILIFLIIISGCQRNELIKTHGISYLEKREAQLAINKSNKNDVIQIMGQPATKGLNDENLWIYIERTKTRGNVLKMGKSYLKKNNVLVLEFNKYGVLVKKDLFNKDDMNKLTFAKATTANEVKKENFIVGFLSSIRQKMEAKKK
jgi:outer membrane protein assembly factor BamE (lipoprotein component of BamABCDE complex)